MISYLRVKYDPDLEVSWVHSVMETLAQLWFHHSLYLLAVINNLVFIKWGTSVMNFLHCYCMGLRSVFAIVLRCMCSKSLACLSF